jgi:hypothetical protein
MGQVGGREYLLPPCAHRDRLAKVHDGGREKSQAAVAVLRVVPGKEALPTARPSSIEPNRSGNSGAYFKVLNYASENGLSSDTWGRPWVFVTPRSAKSSATGLLRIELPRSAWSVSWPG